MVQRAHREAQEAIDKEVEAKAQEEQSDDARPILRRGLRPGINRAHSPEVNNAHHGEVDR